MDDFISAALPWITLGLSLAVWASSESARKQKEEAAGERRENYGVVGMCVGMCIGIALGTALNHMVLGMANGMIIGLSIGQCIHKN